MVYDADLRPEFLRRHSDAEVETRTIDAGAESDRLLIVVMASQIRLGVIGACRPIAAEVSAGVHQRSVVG